MLCLQTATAASARHWCLKKHGARISMKGLASACFRLVVAYLGARLSASDGTAQSSKTELSNQQARFRLHAPGGSLLSFVLWVYRIWLAA